MPHAPHPGFKYSQGLVSTTKEENKKLLDEINATMVTSKGRVSGGSKQSVRASMGL